ncbi:hypothetical protein GALL_468290 [mine drainage metagenome]|uniref:Uncharacterized protein n=1 Tax=mine drainage metagenome TaxID=410659 RepID=A0A1J5PUW1_9ZZZZ
MLQHMRHAVIPRRPRQCLVKAVILGAKRDLVARVKRRLLAHEAFGQGRLNRLGQPGFHQPRHAGHLQRFPQKAGLADFVGVELGDEIAPACQRHHQPRVAQLRQSLAHGGAAGPKARADFRLGYDATRCQIHRQNGRAQRLINLRASGGGKVDFRRVQPRQLQRRRLGSRGDIGGL